MGRLDGKVALLTDDGGGLAAAVGRTFAREGAAVALAASSPEALAPLVAPILETDGNCLPLILDVASPESCARAVAAVVEAFGRLDVLGNLAGSFARTPPLHEIDEVAWDQAIAHNLRSVLLVSRFAVPAIRQSGPGGSIVNLSHVAALNGVPGTSLLAATRGALLNMTRDMAIQGAREGFRVNCVCVGSSFAAVIPSVLEEQTRHPVPAEEIAPIFVYLASDESRHVNGSILTVDDGMHAWR